MKKKILSLLLVAGLSVSLFAGCGSGAADADKATAEGGKDGFQVLGDNKLKHGDGDNVTVTKEQFLKMGYNDRLKLKTENEQLYKQLAKN